MTQAPYIILILAQNLPLSGMLMRGAIPIATLSKSKVREPSKCRQNCLCTHALHCCGLY